MAKAKERNLHKWDLERLEELRLMDDDFFSEALNGKKEAVEFILNTILERTDLKVKHTASQVEYKNAVKRSIKLDIQAEDMNGQILDVEIQRSDSGSGVKRARYHSSMLDRELLEKGDSFEDLVDTYVIFITENDKFNKGIPLYHVERTIEELSHLPFDDGAHIIYVNGTFRNLDHPIGRLMHDFNCKKADEMVNPVLAEEVRYLKETEGGKRQMCKIVEDIVNEVATEVAEEVARDKATEVALKMLEDKLPFDKIVLYSGLDLEEVKNLQNSESCNS